MRRFRLVPALLRNRPARGRPSLKGHGLSLRLAARLRGGTAGRLFLRGETQPQVYAMTRIAKDADHAVPEDEAPARAKSSAQRMTRRVFGPMIAAGAADYMRGRDLPKLLKVSEDELERFTVESTERIVARLTRAARAQGALGRRRHWSYDMNRHLAVLIALKAERASLAHLRNAQGLARLVAAAASPQAASLQASPRAASPQAA